jgi:endonuclease G, mitochondrial
MAVEQEQFRRVVEESRPDRRRTRQLVEQGLRRQAEPDQKRYIQYSMRRAALVLPRGAESVEGDTNDLMPAWFLPAGGRIRRSVGYVVVSDGRKSDAGSGFLISPHLFLTNRHVIPDEHAAVSAQITFDYEMDDQGRPQPTTTYTLDPARFALFSIETELDYALIAIGSRNAGNAALEDLGYCVLSDQPDKHVLGMNVNIIQHPGGWPKMISIRSNLLTGRTPRTLLYETDTDHGSSGGPVLNDDWELVALHHWGEPFLERTDEQGKPFPTNVNEGVRISAIYQSLTNSLATLPPDQRTLLAVALDYSKHVGGGTDGQKRLSPPHPMPDQAEAMQMPRGPAIQEEAADMTESSNSQVLKVVVPLEISLRVGAPQGAVPVASTSEISALSPPAKKLMRGAEKLPLDQDYSNRTGYDPQFVVGTTIPLPEPDAKLAKQVAALRAGEANADGGELQYEHFSIKMNKSKRMAIFSATNIDGNTYLNVDRATGQVKNQQEGETWFKDPRISASFFLDNTFYSAWSNLFDHGHLTRRMDPNWGTPEEAERANADTYHFTNCTPQHFRFNESTKYWQGVEQYVLENGALAADSLNRISVFQGPIFSDKVDMWADDVQIPSAFFKVVVWKGKSGAKSVGLVVDQLALLSEQRKKLGQPITLPSVDVGQWRVGIPTIETRTGLDFGNVIRDADTIKDDAQATPGEAIIKVTSMSDLLPKGYGPGK